MPTITPFHGIVYAGRGSGRNACPPYDIISKKDQEALYRSGPHNFVRLELGKMYPSDTGRDNRYTRSRRTLEAWLKKGVLVADERPAYYIYAMTYRKGAKTKRQIGFMGLMSLRKSTVLPHENTLSAPKADRFELMKATSMNPSPIFVLYDDARSEVTGIIRRWVAHHRPFASVKRAGVEHALWRLDDPKAIARIGSLMRPKETFIADGHHRFEVARKYMDHIARTGLPAHAKDAASRMMVFFCASDPAMLTVLPTHRVLKSVGGLDGAEIERRLGGSFALRREPSLASAMARLSRTKDLPSFGIYLGGRKYLVATMRSWRPSDEVMKDRPAVWRRLDVSVLHHFVLERVLGVPDDEENITYVKDPAEAVALVDGRSHRAAFFLNPTRVEQIKRVAKAGLRMPRKATYFYPKPLSGLVANRIF